MTRHYSAKQSRRASAPIAPWTARAKGTNDQTEAAHRNSDLSQDSRGGCYYVDKTDFIRRLVDGGAHYFLSRPRRFGKSLFLDTLKELFEGNEPLFEGLDIHDHWDWSVRCPVLRLDFGSGDYRTPGYLHQNLMAQLDALERLSGVRSDYTTGTPQDRSGSVIFWNCCISARANEWQCWWTSTTSRFWTH